MNRFMANVRVFFHCLFRLHREHVIIEGFKTVQFGCDDCQKVYWRRDKT